MEKLESALDEILKIERGNAILLELGTGPYFETNISLIKKLQDKGLSGAYVSIQKQLKTIFLMLEKQGIDPKKIIFIEPTSDPKKTQEKFGGYVPISPKLDIDEMIRAIYTSLEKIKGEKFLFIDSLTLLAQYKPISQTLKFSEFLIKLIKDEKDTILILSMTKDLSHKGFIRQILARAGKIIEIEI